MDPSDTRPAPMQRVRADAGPAPEEPALAAAAVADETTRRRWKIEVGLVLLLAVFPDFFNALATHIWPTAEDALPTAMDPYGPGATFASLIIRALQIVPVVLYLIWRSGEPWSSFGFKRFRWFDPLAGAGIFLLVYTVWYGFWLFLWATGLDQSLAVQQSAREGAAWAQVATELGGSDVIVILAGGFCNGVAEEVALYGFLYPRIRRLFGPVAATIVVPILFTSYHIYYDPVSLIWIVIFGVTHALVYAATRRIWPLIVSHIIGDLIWLLQV